MTAVLMALALAVSACAAERRPDLPTVQHVDLQRFMGDWYVIANIPTRLERDAHNSVESYALDSDGTIQTTFTFRKGGLHGTLKRYTPRGFVVDKHTNAVWDMHFGWGVKADYRIIYLTDDYSQTIIGRNKRDYVWIMARSPTISSGDYGRLARWIASLGYDVSKLKRVPQRWD
jgi:apolipoprotein D and lipocalin family protein